MWDHIIGQNRQKHILKEIFRNGKIAHAYLFYGIEGIGKDAAAIEFGKLLNCENPVKQNPCDQCKSCLQFKSFNSPYLSIITALPSLKDESSDFDQPTVKTKKTDPLTDALTAELAEKSRNPYHRISIPKANNILIDSIRKMKNDAYLTGATGKRKVFVISEADKMNPQASNAFLKVLEEPPKNSIFILTTSRPDSILPTISGRCQKIRFDNLSTAEIDSYITRLNPVLSKSDREIISRLSEGSILRCNEILNNDIPKLKNSVVSCLLHLLKGEYNSLGNEVNVLIASKDKATIRSFFNVIKYLVQRCCACQIGFNKRFYVSGY